MSSPTAGLSKTPGTPGGPEPRAIAAFVAAVRQELNDLSPDEVNELTGGLEADLTDALAEPGSAPSPVHGDPAEYASELRAAAGLPPRGTRERRDRGLGLADQVNKDFVVPVQEMMQIARRELEAKPWWPGIWDFLVVLRPAWWVIRAWVVIECLYMISGTDDSAVRGGAAGLLVLLVAIVLSVQLGRHAAESGHWERVASAAWNLAGIVLLLPVMFAASGSSGSFPADYGDGNPSPSGVSLNGEPVQNVFPYDSDGRLLTGVQLYDQDGRPLEISGDNRTIYPESGGEIHLVPGSQVGSVPRWNSFPLQQRRVLDEYDDSGEAKLGPVEPAPLPLTGVPVQPGQIEPTVTATGSMPTSAPTKPAPNSSLSAEPTVGPTTAGSTEGPSARPTAGIVKPTERPSASKSATDPSTTAKPTATKTK